MTALIIESDPGLSDVMKNRILECGFFQKILQATNYKTALAHLEQHQPHVVIMNILIGGTSGYTLLEQLTALEPRPKIMIVTGLNEEDFVRKAVRQGADYYIVKPFDETVFLRRLEQLMQGTVKMTESSCMACIEQDTNQSLLVRINQLDSRIYNILIEIGFSSGNQGINLAIDAIKLVISDPSFCRDITGNLYTLLAKRHNKTSFKAVERSIRSEIDAAYNRGTLVNINRIFNVEFFNGTDKPSNKQLLFFIARKLRTEIVSEFRYAHLSSTDAVFSRKVNILF